VLVLLSWTQPAAWLLAVEVTGYTFVLLLAGLHASWQNGSLSYIVGVPAAIAIMHSAWGAGFLASMFITRTGNPANG
jgi:succinoglycan biosynthesis protein ExoA